MGPLLYALIYSEDFWLNFPEIHAMSKKKVCTTSIKGESKAILESIPQKPARTPPLIYDVFIYYLFAYYIYKKRKKWSTGFLLGEFIYFVCKGEKEGGGEGGGNHPQV